MEGNKFVIGVLRETKNYWEIRTPLIPSDAKVLIEKGIRVVLQPSSSRCFRDAEYQAVGAEINEDLSEAALILGVKEVLPGNFLPNRIYMFFSHTFKAQAYNMPMLDTMIDKKITLIDYECIKNASGNRTVALGKFGGNSGAMDLMQGLGKYLLMKNISSPFLCQGFGYMYRDLADIRREVGKIGDLIKHNGLPLPIVPMVWGILGSGRSSSGVQEILSILPHQILTPDQLAHFDPGPKAQFQIYIVIFPINKLYRRKSDHGFDRQEYGQSPFLYESVFAQKYAKHLSVIYNCLYYETKYPRVLTREDIQGLDKLLGICDITCDLRGAIEICHKFTTPEEPFFLYKPEDDRMYELCKAHVQGSLLYYSMDFLPTELPRDASSHLSHCLLPYLEEICNGEYDDELDVSGLSNDLIDATHLYKGVLTQKYKYIEDLRNMSPNSVPIIDESLREIGMIVRQCPQLASDVDNSKYGQELTRESKIALIRIAKIISEY